MRLRVCHSNPSLPLSSSPHQSALYTSNYRNHTAAGAGQALGRRGSPPESLQLINPTLNYHGPFDRRSEQLYRRHRGDRSGGRVGSHTIYLPPFQNFIQYTPNAILSSQEKALAPFCPWHDWIIRRSTCGERTAGWNLHSGLSLNGIEGGKSKKCVVTCVKTAGTFPQ